MGSLRECTQILGLEGFRFDRIEWEGDEPRAPVRMYIERRGIRGYACSVCRRGRGACAIARSGRDSGLAAESPCIIIQSTQVRPAFMARCAAMRRKVVQRSTGHSTS